MTDNKNRQQDVTRTVVISLKDVQDKIPRREDDPALPNFTVLYETGEKLDDAELDSVLSLFTPAQVVAIVNRWIYQAEYQQQSHVKRAQRQREAERPVKEAFKRLFPGTSYINATPEQIREAAQEAYKEVKSE